MLQSTSAGDGFVYHSIWYVVFFTVHLVMFGMDSLRRLNLFCLTAILSLLSGCALQKQHKPAVLDSRITMKVYSAEILESVINRLQASSGQNFEYNTLMLLPYKAKAAEYRDVTVRSILEEQLKGTPMVYEFRKKKLVIGLKNNDAAPR
ncbi:hypothetical protein ACVW0P_003892 [Mucilaginibacter sp. UYNi724]